MLLLWGHPFLGIPTCTCPKSPCPPASTAPAPTPAAPLIPQRWLPLRHPFSTVFHKLQLKAWALLILSPFPQQVPRSCDKAAWMESHCVVTKSIQSSLLLTLSMTWGKSPCSLGLSFHTCEMGTVIAMKRDFFKL